MYRILIVDDDRIIQKILEVAFTKSGCEVLTADDGWSGLEFLMNRRVDGVIVDRRMPCLDGMELIRRVRKEPELTHIPMIMVSADVGLRHLAMEAGATDYISKPFKSLEVVERLIQYIEATVLVSSAR